MMSYIFRHLAQIQLRALCHRLSPIPLYRTRNYVNHQRTPPSPPTSLKFGIAFHMPINKHPHYTCLIITKLLCKAD